MGTLEMALFSHAGFENYYYEVGSGWEGGVDMKSMREGVGGEYDQIHCIYRDMHA